MIIARRLRIAAIALAAMSCLDLLAPAAVGQVTDADLVRENERLRGQVDDLESALEAALARIAELERKLEAAAHGPADPAVPTPATKPPPAASPEGAIAAIRGAYESAVANGEIPAEAATGDDAAEVRRLRSLRKWVAAANRTFKAPVSWPVIVVASDVVSATDGRLRVQAWDPAEGTTVGDPFDVPVERRVVERLQRPRRDATGSTRVHALEGVFTPTLRLNRQRTEIGTFDKPRFVGPMVEMVWNLDVKSVGDWQPPKAGTPAEDVD